MLIITSTAGARPLPSIARHQALRDDRLQHAGELQADLLLLVRRKHRDDAVDGFGRVERVQRREDEVAGFGGEQAGLDRFEVAHFADQDDVGILPQRAAQRLRERARVDRHLALVDDRLAGRGGGTRSDPRPSSRARSACWLMWSISAASVVLLPLPVVPVTSTSPRSSSAIFFSTGGSPSSSIVRICIGMTRSTRPTVPRCWKTLQRKRPRPGDAVGEVDFLRFLELLALRRRHDRRAHRDDVLVVEPLLLGRRAPARRGRASSDSCRPSGGGRTRRCRRQSSADR